VQFLNFSSSGLTKGDSSHSWQGRDSSIQFVTQRADIPIVNTWIDRRSPFISDFQQTYNGTAW